MKFNWRAIFSSGGIGYLLFDATAKILDGDPLTNPAWDVLISAAFVTISALFTKAPGQTDH